ncbi:MAG TPA: 2-hydroxyglutaryl-CoA dehydratase, partial [Firmicutes bacterium]|nr:2-hydroxyglutaryl-CoA dehydratase [Bacillota bacterium]
MQGYLGIDVGSVSTNIVILSETGQMQHNLYLRTHGQPIAAIQNGLRSIMEQFQDLEVLGVGCTGSGRRLTGVLSGADLVKNEITAHAVAAMYCHPEVQTVLEIGGQDSKIIVIRNGVVSDFAMNTVCAAGTGSFLDQQASRLGVAINDFGGLALKSENPVRIAGRCTVFAESDMIHKQQVGHSIEDITAGLCESLVRNYLANVGKGKEIREPVLFQGGVAANAGIRAAFEKQLEVKLIIPEHFSVMGAIGSALLAREEMLENPRPSSFRGFTIADRHYITSSFECTGCPNMCEIVRLTDDSGLLANWGGRCGKWDSDGVVPGKAVTAAANNAAENTYID